MEELVDRKDLLAQMLGESTRLLSHRFEAILRIKGVIDKYDLIVDLAVDIVKRSNIAISMSDSKVYSPMDGYTFRIFNGVYWERCYSKDLMYVLEKCLRSGGITMAMLFRLERAILSRVVTTVRDKRLRPRLTLMCFRNGVVDFNEACSGKKLMLHKFSPEYDVVKQYDIKFDLDAECPLWENFLGIPSGRSQNLDGMLPERAKRKQLQTFLGSLLLDRSKVKFEYFMILQGNGANGKGVIFQLIQNLFGADEVSTLELSNLMKSGDEGMRAAASLDGKRVLYCPEEVVVRNAKNLTFLKSIVSGEPIQARSLGENIKTVTPPVVMFNTNHRFKTSEFFNDEDSKDISMLRRVNIINFERSVPAGQRDTMLAQRLMNERNGIFAWIVKGFMDLKRNRWKMPETAQGQVDLVIEKARNDIEVDGNKVSGIVALYLDKKCSVPYDTGVSVRIAVPFNQIYNNFTDFCRNEGLDAVSDKKFARDLSVMGYKKTKVQKGGAILYNIYCTDEDIARNYAAHLPSLLEEAKATIFGGVELDEELEFEDETVEIE
jgi:putative DNA primase/helicase